METTITLSQAAGRIAINVGGDVIATVKDGNGLMARVDDALRANGISRGGFTAANGALVADGVDLR